MPNDRDQKKPGTIGTRTADGVGWLTFDNVGRHNALSMGMLTEIPKALADFDADPAVGVVVIRGAGERAFVSGADISEFGERRTSPEARAEYDQISAEAHRGWETFTKPVIAMISGYCLGGGVNTALDADIRIAADNATFAVPAGRLGLGYGFDNIERLMGVIGPSWAAEVLFSARRFSAEEGFAMGLVNRVVPLAKLEEEVTTLATTIAGNAPLTLRAAKAAMREVRREPDLQDKARVAELVEACFRSEDYLEGQKAFLEKRRPRFLGR